MTSLILELFAEGVHRRATLSCRDRRKRRHLLQNCNDGPDRVQRLVRRGLICSENHTPTVTRLGAAEGGNSSRHGHNASSLARHVVEMRAIV